MPDTASIRDILHASYHRDHWHSLLTSLFPDGSLRLFQRPEDLAATHENVTATRQLGNITLPDGETVALLEVTAADQVKLARNRVGLRNFVASFIDQAQTSAVLAVFHQENSPDWRLTYAAKTTTLDQDTFEVVSVETAPRRFTFLLGENEPCRTAAARLSLLQEKGDDLALGDLEKAFSVESLTKDFFKKYKAHYQIFIDHLLSHEQADATRTLFEIPTLTDDKEQEKADKPVRDFVKTLLGRLVFLHFLQKKSWLGCPKGSRPWKGGDTDFLQSFLQFARDKNEEDLFHSGYLSKLFFEALNEPDRPGDLFPLTDSRLPYLNGGLFDDEQPELREINFPAQLFTDVLNFFGEYNFTIDENDPEDHEVGIDPEMLGMIFENLLEDNKEKGAYYTPKAIVSYMARQSLLHYLQTHLGENEELEKLLNEKDISNEHDYPFVTAQRQEISRLLEKVTICDPAIGSGAFPIGLLHEILWTRLTLEPELNTPEHRAHIKREIIQNSIHGVDIDPGAIEIARLRFWLALVVDEEEPRPLPNLDYKIHRADSLIEYIRGEAVNLGVEPPKDDPSKAAVAELITAKQALFTAQRIPEKRSAWLALYRSLAQLAQAEFTYLRNEEGLFAEGERVAKLDQNAHAFGQWIQKIDAIKTARVHHQDTLLDELKHWFDDPENPTFLWNLHFGGVFADGGFDIVIANPPYVRNKHLTDSYKELLWPNYDCFVKKADLYTCFLEKAISLTNKGGSLMFITSNTYLRLDSFAKIRKLLLKELQIKELIEFDGNVFDTATVKTVILSGNVRCPNTTVKYRKGREARGALSSETIVIPISFWEDAHQNIFDTSYSRESAALNSKLLTTGHPLSSNYSTSFGLKTGDDSRWLARSPFETNSKELYRGRDVSKYQISWGGWHVEYDTISMRKHRKTARPGTLDRFQSPKVLICDTGNHLEAFWDQEGLFVKDVLIASSIHSSKIEDGFLTTLLNSTTLRFHYELTYQTLHVQQNELKKLPIPPATPADKTKLATLAEQCAAAAAADDQATLAAREAEINQIVYRLFDLTDEEIHLIESSLEG